MSDFSWDIGTLKSQLYAGNREAIKLFSLPHELIWCETQEKTAYFIKWIQEKQIREADDPSGLLQLVLASWLLNPEKAYPAIEDWIQSQIDSNYFDLPLPLENLTAMRWIRIACPVVSDTHESIRYFLAGLGEHSGTDFIPSWSSQALDQVAIDAVRSAVYFACQKTGSSPNSVFIWPIVFPFSSSPVIFGNSIGLPIYLAIKGLLSGHSLPSYLLCTGALSKGGELETVKGLSQKYAETAKKGFSAFIYPAIEADDLKSIPNMIPERLPVRSLREAELCWNKYSPGNGNSVHNYLAWLKDPETLVMRLTDIPDDLFPLSIEEKSEIKASLMQLLKKTSYIGTLVDNLETYIKKPDWSPKKLDDLLAVCDEFMISRLSDIEELNPILAFRLSLIQIRKANHSGQIGASIAWSNKAKGYYERVGDHLDDDWDKFLILFLEIIGTQHNSYNFVTKIPDDVECELALIQSSLEDRFRGIRIKAPSKVSPLTILAGEYYGTMMQHYAFCGSQHLKKSLFYSDKALDAFGYSNPDSINVDSQRQFSYRVLAFLDANESVKAEENLRVYLKASPADLIEIENLGEDPYKHAVYARFQADTGKYSQTYFDWACSNIPAEARHPWQLWLYNMGRVAEKQSQKEMFWFKSLEFCLVGGITIKAMALLPLSSLHTLDLKLEQRSFILCKTKEILSIIRNESGLHLQHFANILEASNWEDALKEVSINLKKYFPFSYR